MDVQTLQFTDRDELAKAFERIAGDARIELCVADPSRLLLRYALGLPPVADASGRRSLHGRSRPSRDPGSPAEHPRSSTWR